MRYAMREALLRLLLLEATTAVFLFVGAYFCLDELAEPTFLAQLSSLYHASALLHVGYVIAALGKFCSIFLRRLPTALVVAPNRHSPRLQTSSSDDDWLGEPRPSHASATVEAELSSPAPSYGSPAAETVWINPSTGYPMLNGPGSFDTSGHTWMQ